MITETLEDETLEGLHATIDEYVRCYPVTEFGTHVKTVAERTLPGGGWYAVVTRAVHP